MSFTFPDRTFRECAQSYIENGGEARYLQPIIEFFGDRQLTSIFPFDIEQMAITLFPTQSNSTKNRIALTPTRAVIYHGYKRGWCNMLRLSRFKPEPPKRKKPASFTWLHAFVRRCDKDCLPHLAALVIFMSQTGARVSEAIRVTWRDVDLSTRSINLVKTKTSINSVRNLTDEMIGRLYAMRAGSEPDDRVFRFTNRHSVNERIKAVCRRADITYKSSHAAGRHSFATNAMEMGLDIRTVMAAGDWKSSNIFLEIYVHPRRNAGRVAADRFNMYQFDGEV